jgi:hypothetical protein
MPAAKVAVEVVEDGAQSQAVEAAAAVGERESAGARAAALA